MTAPTVTLRDLTPHDSDRIHAWRNSERQRLFKLRAEIAKLEAGDTSTPQARERMRSALEGILKLLP